MDESVKSTDAPQPEATAAPSLPTVAGQSDSATPQELRTHEGRFVPGVRQPTAKPWKPGESGNPSGISNTKRLTKALVEALERDNGDLAQALIRSAIKQALSGNFKFFQEIFNRSDGPLAHLLAGHDGGPLLPGGPTQEQLDAMMTSPEIMAAAHALGELVSAKKRAGNKETPSGS